MRPPELRLDLVGPDIKAISDGTADWGWQELMQLQRHILRKGAGWPPLPSMYCRACGPQKHSAIGHRPSIL